MPDSLQPLPQGLKFYGRRRGKKLRLTGETLMTTMLPRLEIPQPAAVFDPAALFSDPIREIWLEIGFGGGEHAATQAEIHADIGLVACEVFRNGIASLLGHINMQALENIRIFPEDARLLLPYLPEASIARAFVLFPDPWRKTRHAERRFIGTANLDALARVLKDQAELRVASDDPTYIPWARKQLSTHAGFELARESQGERPSDWAPTRYETKALAAGRAPVYFTARRKNRILPSTSP